MSPTMITSLFGAILRVGRTFTPPMGTPNGTAELKEEPEKFQRALIALADEFCSEKHPQEALVATMKKEQA